MEAARKIITDQGMEHLTIENLAAEIGVSEAAIYRHVKSKQEVLFLVLKDIEETLLEAVSQAQEQETSAIEKLRSTLKAHLSYAERRRGVSFLVLNEAQRLDDKALRKKAGEVVEKYLEAIRRILAEGRESKEVSQDVDIEMAARLFFGMVQSTVTLWSLQSHSFALTEGYEALWSLYQRAVSGRR